MAWQGEGANGATGRRRPESTFRSQRVISTDDSDTVYYRLGWADCASARFPRPPKSTNQSEEYQSGYRDASLLFQPRFTREGEVSYTDYPFTELGDEPYKPAPLRAVEVMKYDGNKYCTVRFSGTDLTVKVGYLFTVPTVVIKSSAEVAHAGEIARQYRKGASAAERGKPPRARVSARYKAAYLAGYLESRCARELPPESWSD